VTHEYDGWIDGQTDDQTDIIIANAALTCATNSNNNNSLTIQDTHQEMT